MDAETARTIVNGCAALPICVYRIAVLAGGSIFLGLPLIMIGWTDPRHSASVCTAFVLVNSAAGLAGDIVSVHTLPTDAPLLAVDMILGASQGLNWTYASSPR